VGASSQLHPLVLAGFRGERGGDVTHPLPSHPKACIYTGEHSHGFSYLTEESSGLTKALYAFLLVTLASPPLLPAPVKDWGSEREGLRVATHIGA
jgi:hypothetical protein